MNKNNTNYDLTEIEFIMKKMVEAIEKEEKLLFKSCLTIMVDTGLRISEVLSLKKSNLVQELGYYPVLQISVNKVVEKVDVTISEKSLNTINILENRLEELSNGEAENLFLKENGKRYSNDEVNRDFREFIKRNKIVNSKGQLVNITPNFIRHSYMRMMIKNLNLERPKDITDIYKVGTNIYNSFKE